MAQKQKNPLEQYGYLNPDPYGFKAALTPKTPFTPDVSLSGNASQDIYKLLGIGSGGAGWTAPNTPAQPVKASPSAAGSAQGGTMDLSNLLKLLSGGGGGGGGGTMYGYAASGKLPSLGDFPKPPSGHYTSADLARANDIINLQYNPQFAALERERKLGQFDYDKLVKELEQAQQMGIQTQQKYGQLGDVKLQQIFNALQGELQGGLQQTRGIYEQGGQKLSDIYSNAQQSIGQAGGEVQGGLQKAANALGLTAALPDPMARLSAELAGIKGRTAEAGAASQANLATLGTQMEGIGEQGIVQSRQELAGRRADLVSDINKTMGNIQVEFAKGRSELSSNLQRQMMDIADRYSTLTAQKGIDLRETLRQVEEARTDRERQYYMDKFNSQLQLAQLDLQRSQLSVSRSAARSSSQSNILDTIKSLQGIEANQRGLVTGQEGFTAGKNAITSGGKTLEAYRSIMFTAPDAGTAFEMVKNSGLKPAQQNELTNALEIAYGVSGGGAPSPVMNLITKLISGPLK